RIFGGGQGEGLGAPHPAEAGAAGDPGVRLRNAGRTGEPVPAAPGKAGLPVGRQAGRRRERGSLVSLRRAGAREGPESGEPWRMDTRHPLRQIQKALDRSIPGVWNSKSVGRFIKG
ncbi:MAG: hypothetical protein ACE5JU_22505, partial [Candidatus Binatia bacterium]